MERGRELKYLVIHCTATPAGRNVTADEIKAWHTGPTPKGRGWKQVGYRDMIHLDGRIENLVPNNNDNIVDPWEITNGARGYNDIAEHVVYVGGLDENRKPADTRTAAQRKALVKYVLYFNDRFPGIKIVGHTDLDNRKSCPCYDVAEWLKMLGIE